MLALLQETEASILYWIKAQYRDDPPEMAQDASPAKEMQKRFAAIAKKWQKRWEDGADKIAKSFIKGSYSATESSFRSALRDAGISVKFSMTPAVQDAFNAQVAENVALIKNIPQQYLTQVEGIIQRSYSGGKNLDYMIDGIQKETGVSHRRVVNISKDQSNKAHSTIERARRLELGLEEAAWIHSGGGQHPRPEHVKAGRERRVYSVREGCPIPDEKGRLEHIQPGEKVGCRCVSRVVIPGLVRQNTQH